MLVTAVTVFLMIFTFALKIASYHYLNLFMKRNLRLIIFSQEIC